MNEHEPPDRPTDSPGTHGAPSAESAPEPPDAADENASAPQADAPAPRADDDDDDNLGAVGTDMGRVPRSSTRAPHSAADAADTLGGHALEAALQTGDKRAAERADGATLYALRPFAPVRPPVMAAGAVVSAGLLLLVALRIGSSVALGVEVDLTALIIGGLLLGGLVTFVTLGLSSWRALRRPPGAVTLDDTSVLLPSPWGGKPRSVPLPQLTALELRARGGHPIAVIATRQRIWFLGGVHFEGGDEAVVRLYEGLRGRLKAQDGGAEQLKAMDARLDALAFALSRRPLVSLLVVLALGLVYLVEIEQGIPEHPWGLIDVGGLVPPLVASGEAWRLAASQLLHVDGWHLWIDVVSLLFVGAIVERHIGRMRAVIVLLGAGLAGSAATAFLSAPVLAVGASAGVWGLFGAAAVVRLRFADRIPAGLRQSGAWWIVLVLGAALLPFAQEHVDAVALGVGLVVGGALTFVLAPSDLQPGMPPPAGLGLQLAAASLLAVFVGSAGVAFSTEPRPPEAQIAALISAELEHDDVTEARVLPLTRALARSKDPAKAEIEVALKALARLEGGDARPEVLEVQAKLTYQLDQPVEAIALLRRSLGPGKPSPARVNAMARYAADAKVKPLFIYDDDKEVPVKVEAGRPLKLRFEDEVKGVFVLAAIEAGQDGKPGFAVARVPGPVSGNIEVVMPKRAGTDLPGYATLRPLVVAVGDCGCDKAEVRFVPLERGPSANAPPPLF